MKKFIKMTVVSFIFILSVSVFSGCGNSISVESVKENPMKAVLDGFDKSTEKIIKKYDGLSAFAEEIEDGYTAEFNFNSASGFGDVVSSSFSVVKSEDKFLLKSGTSLGDDFSGTEIYKDDDLFAFKSDVIGEDYYGINLKSFPEDMKNSVLLDIMGITYEEFQAEFNSVLDLFSGKYNAEFDKEQIYEFCKDIAVDVYETKVSLNKIETEAVGVSFEFDSEKAGNAFSGMLSNIYGVDFSEDIHGDGVSEPEIFVLEFLLRKSDGKLVSVKLSQKDGAESFTVFIESDGLFALTLKLPETETSDMEYDEYDVSPNVYRIEEINDKDKSGFSVGYLDDEENSVTVLSIVRTLSDNTFKLKSYGINIVQGSVSLGDGKLEVKIDNVSGGINTEGGFSITAGGEIAAAPEYKNIILMTVEELWALIEKLEYGFSGGISDDSFEDYYGEDYFLGGDYYQDDYFSDFSDESLSF